MFRIFSRSRLINLSRQQNVIKSFLHNTKVLSHKKFQQVETEQTAKFVYRSDFSEFLLDQESKQKLEYTDELINSVTDDKTNSDLIQMLDVIAEHCQLQQDCITNEKYDKFVSEIVKKVPTFDQADIVRMLLALKKLPPTKSAYSRNYGELWQALDVECVKRCPKFDHKYVMQLCTLWNDIHLAKLNQFCYNGLRKVGRNVRKLTAVQLVQLLFFVSVCRKNIDMLEVELRVDEILKELTIQQLSVVCLSFFKSESKIKSFSLVSKIFEKITADIHQLNDISIVSILKCLRYSCDVTHASHVEALNEVLADNTDKYSLMALLHMALLGTNLQMCHDRLIENVLQRFIDELDSARLKDIERFTLALGIYNYKSADGKEKILAENILKQIQNRTEEFGKYPKCLSNLLHFLTIIGHHDIETMKSVLSQKFIKFTYGKNHYAVTRDVLCLDSYARINLKGVYDGPFLDEKMRVNIAKFQTCYIPYRLQKWKLSMTDKLILDLQAEIENKYGVSKLTHILPHYQVPDIAVCFDKNGKAVTEQILQCFPKDYSGNIISKEFLFSQKPEFSNYDDYKMLALVIGGWNMFVRGKFIDGEPVYTGALALKVKQLELIGYRPVVMYWEDWVRKPVDERLEIFHGKIKKALKD